MDQRTPLQTLIEELKTAQPDHLIKVAKTCEQTQNIQITTAILHIKLNQPQEALLLLKNLKDHQLYSYTRLYALYKDTQYNQVITECKKHTAEEILLLAQCHIKLEQFNQAIELYLQLLKENKLPGDHIDIYTNLLNAVIQNQKPDEMRQINLQTIDFVKKIKNQCNRELLLNHSLLNLALKEFKTAKELIIRFENLVKIENEQDEDLVLAQIILDLLDQSNLATKISYYETFEKAVEQPILTNNLLVYSEKLHHHNHDAVKKFEEILNSDYKFTPAQTHTLKLNRAILLIVRNRQPKEHDLPETLQIAVHKLKWEKPITDLFQFLVFATNNDNPTKILELCAVPNWAQNPILCTLLLHQLLKVDDSKFGHILQLISENNKQLLCNYYIKKGNLEKALECYQTEQIGQLALLCLEKGKLDQASKFIDSLDYQGITDMNLIENLEKNINLSKKVEVSEKKIQKKKKKRVRYPKNFDKNNPGAVPNAERWLPKYERKEWKKKKQMKSRTQGAGLAGKETMNTFANQGASTAQINATQKKKNKHKR